MQMVSVSRIKAAMPTWLEPLALAMWYRCRPAVRIAFFGRRRYCVICESWCRKFLAHKSGRRRFNDVVCPVCLSHPRHRLAWLYLSTSTDLADGSARRILHFAPEPMLMRKFKSLARVDYLSADLSSPHATLKADITDTGLPAASFEFVYCSHVLEHIVEDRKAMREIFRLLKPGRWALIIVPVRDAPTFENPSVTDPRERDRVFGQSDHVRIYGPDVKDRLAAAGFEVEKRLGREVALDRCELLGIRPGEPIFRCTKPATAR